MLIVLFISISFPILGMMIFDVLTLRSFLDEIVQTIIQRISILVMNDLALQDRIIGMGIIPNVMRAMNISAFGDGRVFTALVGRNPDEKIFLRTFISAARFPSPLEVWMIRPLQSLPGPYFFSHATRRFVRTSTATMFGWFALRVNASKNSFANRTVFSCFHTGIVA